jgi:hypothetical protein
MNAFFSHAFFFFFNINFFSQIWQSFVNFWLNLITTSRNVQVGSVCYLECSGAIGKHIHDKRRRWYRNHGKKERCPSIWLTFPAKEKVTIAHYLSTSIHKFSLCRLFIPMNRKFEGWILNLFLTKLFIKVKPNINSLEVHSLASNKGYPVDDRLVGAGSLWLKISGFL